MGPFPQAQIFVVATDFEFCVGVRPFLTRNTVLEMNINVEMRVYALLCLFLDANEKNSSHSDIGTFYTISYVMYYYKI